MRLEEFMREHKVKDLKGMTGKLWHSYLEQIKWFDTRPPFAEHDKKKAAEFLREHNVEKVEELNHIQLIDFAIKCMDVLSSCSVQDLMLECWSHSIDQFPDKLDSLIIEAFNNNMRVRSGIIDSEGVFADSKEADKYKSGFVLEVVPFDD